MPRPAARAKVFTSRAPERFLRCHYIAIAVKTPVPKRAAAPVQQRRYCERSCSPCRMARA